MFGGLTKTSSRIAIAAAFGLTLGGYALSSGPALAADYGGDCCADLEERVAELEATTVRKGNKKVSVTLSGWVVKTVSWWDDGDLSEAHVGDKDADLTSRFAITGSATIAPGWSGGYNITVTVPGAFVDDHPAGQVGNVFGINSDQFNEDSGLLAGINTLYSYMYVKSDTWGAINWGYLSPASDNPAVLADLSGTVIESNGVWFEGSGFFLRPKGSGVGGLGGLSGLVTPVNCNSGIGNIGVDCYGGPQSGVRYDTPTWGGFRAEVSWTEFVENIPLGAPNIDTYDAAVFYNGDWGNFKVSAAYSYTHMDGNLGTVNLAADVDTHQAGATIMHVPSGLGLYGMYQNDGADGNFFNPLTGTTQGLTDTDAWYIKPFIKRTWNPAGATVLYGEYGQYNDQFNNNAGVNVCGSFVGVSGALLGNAGAFCGANGNIFITGTEAERWGLGVVQEIDSAAMHLFARWQHSEVDIDFAGFNFGALEVQSVGQGFDELDIFQVGGIIFF